ncbi:MAG: PH domain-containing protein [Roseiflexaceae bacterium]|nr:PH domain-containing protein [Roseiflexus sp.]MDW8213366.1 PH domain-containing protein [Roseiflexaceae bacterium]
MSPGWPVYDDESQYRRIVAYLMPGETLYAVYDCKGVGTGFVGITDRRVIFYDQGMLARKRAMVSLPYQHISAVAVADEGVIFQSGEVILLTSFGRFSFEFRSPDKADWVHRFILGQIVAPKHPSPSTGL